MNTAFQSAVIAAKRSPCTFQLGCLTCIRILCRQSQALRLLIRSEQLGVNSQVRLLMPTRESTTKSPTGKTSTEIILCDPCQYKGRGQTTICGYQGKSLASHLKSHVMANGSKMNIKTYRNKFPSFSVGVPSYSPPPESVAKLIAANPMNLAKPPPETAEEKSAKAAEYDAKIAARMDVLWSMCERDPAARQTCVMAARDEITLDELYNELEKLRKLSKPDSDTLKFLNQNLAATKTRYDDSMKSLSLTVTQRRASNQLGTDSVSQIICGYANTLRKMSPEKQEAFHRRVATVLANIAERVRVKILSEVNTSFDQAMEDMNDSDDFRAAILRFNPETK
jgi:hypothetical protein